MKKLIVPVLVMLAMAVYAEEKKADDAAAKPAAPAAPAAPAEWTPHMTAAEPAAKAEPVLRIRAARTRESFFILLPPVKGAVSAVCQIISRKYFLPIKSSCDNLSPDLSSF